jgi:hypothetical protein
MPITPELRRVLYTISELSHNNLETSVLDSAVQRETRLPNFELDRLLKELDSLGLITILRRPSGVEFRLLNMTSLGLHELTSDNN